MPLTEVRWTEPGQARRWGLTQWVRRGVGSPVPCATNISEHERIPGTRSAAGQHAAWTRALAAKAASWGGWCLACTIQRRYRGDTEARGMHLYNTINIASLFCAFFFSLFSLSLSFSFSFSPCTPPLQIFTLPLPPGVRVAFPSNLAAPAAFARCGSHLVIVRCLRGA
jgi:hypothetical protein